MRCSNDEQAEWNLTLFDKMNEQVENNSQKRLARARTTLIVKYKLLNMKNMYIFDSILRLLGCSSWFVIKNG